MDADAKVSVNGKHKGAYRKPMNYIALTIHVFPLGLPAKMLDTWFVNE